MNNEGRSINKLAWLNLFGCLVVIVVSTIVLSLGLGLLSAIIGWIFGLGS
jgi:hypothetical protein